MAILVTGANGQLGHDVVNELSARGIDCKGVDLADFDLTNRAETLAAIAEYSPEAVIHCAAYTAVDKAEDDRDVCFAVNVDGTQNIADACRAIGAKMMYISTDYVFDGEGDAPFETDSPTGAKSHYGYTKRCGEEQVMAALTDWFILRISWVFGQNGNNFVKTMLRLAESRDTISVVGDQIGSPTYTFDLARLICDMIVTDRYGIYHATNEGLCSWSEFAAEIFKIAGKPVTVTAISTEDYPTKAVRPKNSRLSKASLDAAGFSRLPDWRDALARYIGQL